MASFAEQITRWAELSRLKGRTVIREIAFSAYEGILYRSPVKDGRFRGSHRIGINRVDTTTLGKKNKGGRAKGAEFRDPPTGAEKAYALEKLAKATWEDEIIISNSLPYAKRLEDGYSKQNGHKPGGIYKDTLEEVRGHLAKKIKEAIGEVHGI